MANIDDLPNKNISDMTDDELAERFRAIKMSREVPKRARRMSTATKRSKEKTVKKDPIASMTPEQKAYLLKKLMGGSDG